ITGPIGAFDAVILVHEIGEPLVRLAAEKAIKAFEAHSKRPVVVRARVACFVGRRLVPLANVKRAVTGLLQYLGNRRLASRHPPVEAGITRRRLGYHSKMIGVMVVTGEQASAR